MATNSAAERESDPDPDPTHAPVGEPGADAETPARHRGAEERRDPMGPPDEPCECYCLHCGRTFMSDRIWFQRVLGDPDGFDGFWMCPTPNCSGAGFTFDIFPTDPVHPANDGWCYTDDDEEDDGEWSDEFDEAAAGENEYDPEEKKWKALEALEEGEFADDDLEGEEWKYGLEPGQRPEPQVSPEARQWQEQAQREWEEEQKSYDEPDRRPRELDWSDRPPRRRRTDGTDGDAGEAPFSEDDIPF